MKPYLLKHLICPETGESLELEVLEERNEQIKEGRLIGSVSRFVYPIADYVPRFVKADEYAGTFSKQRLYVKRHFRHYREDRSGLSLFYESTGFSKEQISRGLTLEVGCGYGRFVDVVQQQGAEIVGVDLSTQSINLAQSFVGLRPNVNLVQCDLFKLPFRKSIFNSIYSIGVLHHTPDCRAAFLALPEFLSANGQISVWIYHPSNQSNVARWRRITTKWSPSKLYAFCILNQLLFSWIRRIPRVRWYFNDLVPGSVPKRGQHFWLRVLEDFDNLAPNYASHHYPREVVEWFKEAGLNEIKVLNRLTAITGFRKLLDVSGPSSTAVGVPSP